MNLHAHTDAPSPIARVSGAALLVAPLLLLSSTLAYVTEGNGINDGVLGGTIGVWSCFAFLIGYVGIYRLIETSKPMGAAILMVLASTAWAAGVAFNITAMHIALVPGLEPTLDAAMNEGSNAIGWLAFLPWGWFAPISLVVTGVMLWRAHLAARWSCGLLIAGGILFVASRPERINVLAVIADAALVIALVPIGWAVLTDARATSATPKTAAESASS